MGLLFGLENCAMVVTVQLMHELFLFWKSMCFFICASDHIDGMEHNDAQRHSLRNAHSEHTALSTCNSESEWLVPVHNCMWTWPAWAQREHEIAAHLQNDLLGSKDGV